MKIGNRIKQLRRKKGITQEDLANILGVSFQAVSKWENDIAYPDITLIPIIADYFDVSTDYIFDYNKVKLNNEVKKMCEDSYLIRESNPEKSKRILEDGLAKYPNNDMLLNYLLYFMNYRDNPDKTIKFASKLAANTDNNTVKYDSLRYLAYAYQSKGDIENAKAAIDQLPEIYFNKLTEIAYIHSGIEKFNASSKQFWISFDNMLQMLEKMAEYYEDENDKEKSKECREDALKFIKLINNKTEYEQYKNYEEFFKIKIELLTRKL